MDRIEKTVFLSYRRTDWPLAEAVCQNLGQHGYDVFFDRKGIASGDFKQVIVENIRARAHFLVLLTPSALERCHERDDVLRLEIETALENRRNIVPLLVDDFDFGSRVITKQLTGALSALRNYNGLHLVQDLFEARMEQLRNRYLNVSLTAVLHPASATAKSAAIEQRATNVTPRAQKTELSTRPSDRAFPPNDPILGPQPGTIAGSLHARDANDRGRTRLDKKDYEGSIHDFSEAIRLNPRNADAFSNRGFARRGKGDLDGAIEDFNEAIRLNPHDVGTLTYRGVARQEKGDLDGAIEDFSEAIRLNPDASLLFKARGDALRNRGDLNRAMGNYNTAIRLNPTDAEAYYGRAVVFQDRSLFKAAIVDYQKYLDLGGGSDDGTRVIVEFLIRSLRQNL